MAARNSDYQNAFGVALSKQLDARRTSPAKLADAVDASPAYISRMMGGTRDVSPEWADTIAKALKLNKEETVELHRAAAATAGYKLDLTKKS